jgi:hypothetical protein
MTMLAMGKHWRLRWGLQLTLLVLCLSSACSRPVGLQGGAESHEVDPQSVPFHQGSDSSAVSNSGPHAGTRPTGSADEDESDPAAARGVPFRASSTRILSAGTLLTVRLESSLSSAKLDIGRTFVAVVDEPVGIGGSTIVSRARVRGRVESARVSDVRRDAGYVRLTLESIRIDGRDVPLQTSSLFARGTAGDAPAGHSGDWSAETSRLAQSRAAHSTIIRLKKGRRLTFRLTEDVDLGGSTGEEPVSKKPPLSSKTQPTTE